MIAVTVFVCVCVCVHVCVRACLPACVCVLVLKKDRERDDGKVNKEEVDCACAWWGGGEGGVAFKGCCNGYISARTFFCVLFISN